MVDENQTSTSDISAKARRQRPGGGGLGTRLGLASFALGLPAVAAPAAVARLIGVGPTAGTTTLLRAIGAREFAAGTAVLASPRPVVGLWARVAGDALDLALLGRALRDRCADRRRLTGALAAVAGIAALDVLAAARAAGRPGAGSELVAASSITVNRPAEQVYGFWRDLENLPRFMAHVESVRVGNGRSHWVAAAPVTGSVEWDAEVTDDEPGRLIAWRAVEGADVPNSGSVRFDPTPDGSGTEVRVELTYRPPAGRLGKAVGKLLGEEPQQQVSDDLRRFKQVLETGEVVRSEATPEGPFARRLLSQQPGQPSD